MHIHMHIHKHPIKESDSPLINCWIITNEGQGRPFYIQVGLIGVA